MRIIDADKLTEELWQDIIDQRKRRISEVIQEQPTVEAIPIEWIKEWINRPFLYQEIAEGTIEMMLEDWREESGRS